MRDAWEMWKEPRMVVLAGVCAAVYAAAMIPFKFLTIIPGSTEIRPATVFPIVFSFLFGPAGAWGAGFGNVVGDFLGGQLGIGSIFGFFGNFAYGYIPYKLWEAWRGERDVARELETWKGRVPKWMFDIKKVGLAIAGIFVGSAALLGAVHYSGVYDLGGIVKLKWGEQEFKASMALALPVLALGATMGLVSVLILVFSPIRMVLVILISSLAIAGIIAWGIEIIGGPPFYVLGLIILFNNFTISVLLAPSLLMLLYPRVEKRFMLYRDLFGERRPKAIAPRTGAIILVVSVLVLFVGGCFFTPDQVLAIMGTSSLQVKGLIFSPLLLLLFIGLFLL